VPLLGYGERNYVRLYKTGEEYSRKDRKRYKYKMDRGTQWE
jgi:hypothetical protein